MAASTVAAPHMSNFISSMRAGSLSEMPPVSKVTPLPTSTTGRAAATRAAVLEHDEARRLGAAAGDRQQAAHLQAADRRLIEDPHAQRRRIAAPRARAPARRGSAACRHWRAGCPGCAAARALAPAPRRRRARGAPAASAVGRHRAASTRASAGGRGLRADFRSLMRYRRGAGDLGAQRATEVIIIEFAQPGGRSSAMAALSDAGACQRRDGVATARRQARRLYWPCAPRPTSSSRPRAPARGPR